MYEMIVGTKFKFMARRKIFYVISASLILITIISLILHGGPRMSVDFTGGNVLAVAFSPAASVDDVRAAADAARLEGAEVQMADQNTQAIIRFQTSTEDSSGIFDRFKAEMAGKAERIEFLSLETVGPKIGKELGEKAVWAVLWSQILILLYVAWRFRRVSFGLGAIIALFHDVVVTIGALSILDREISLTVIAALLTISGYSVNDTIVVFDRIRENMGLLRRMSFAEVIDKSVNQTLSRTILTSGLTLLSVLSLFFLGGPVIHDFSLALLVGLIAGSYSTIFVASALGMDLSNWWTRRKAKAEGHAPKTAAVS